MKRNITINMCGRLFAIDEDAYEVLNAYERSLRSHFRGHEGGEEIANDLEERIAELMDELKAQGIEAVNIDHVQDIIRRLGNPQQMDGAEAPSEDEAEATAAAAEKADAVHKAMSQEGSAAKRLYRNKEDKKWMGVLSGFAAYFGGDVLWWRLGFAALFLISSLGIFEVFWPWWMWKVMTNICIVSVSSISYWPC